jgi:hypothetical protein
MYIIAVKISATFPRQHKETIPICMNVQLYVTIYRFILETQQLYMFRAFLAHHQE